MKKSEFKTVEASSAKGFQLPAGSTIRVINTMGSQVVGMWAFVRSNMSEYMSMEHSRIHSKSSRPQTGTVFFTNTHEKILEMKNDRSPGVHDWFLAACNQQRYELLGYNGHHANCTDNLLTVLSDLGFSTPVVPCPLNLFENVSLLYGNSMEIKQPVTMPGDYVEFKTHVDCLVILSSCPQDILPTNGPDLTPRSFDVEINMPD